MPRQVIAIEIEQQVSPSIGDHLFGTAWHWKVRDDGGGFRLTYKVGWARSEQAARKKAEKAARSVLQGYVRYSYNPEGIR